MVLHEGTVDCEAVAMSSSSMGFSSAIDNLDSIDNAKNEINDSKDNSEGYDSVDDSLSE